MDKKMKFTVTTKAIPLTTAYSVRPEWMNERLLNCCWNLWKWNEIDMFHVWHVVRPFWYFTIHSTSNSIRIRMNFWIYANWFISNAQCVIFINTCVLLSALTDSTFWIREIMWENCGSLSCCCSARWLLHFHFSLFSYRMRPLSFRLHFIGNHNTDLYFIIPDYGDSFVRRRRQLHALCSISVSWCHPITSMSTALAMHRSQFIIIIVIRS